MTIFAGDSSLYASVRRARELLEDLWDRQYPGASWLPIIYQNPTANAPRWDELYRNTGIESSESNNNINIDEQYFTVPLFDNILAKKSPSLLSQLINIRQMVAPILQQIPITPYSHDSLNHARQVLILYSELFSKPLEDFFSPDEMFIIGLFCLLHDIGMQDRPGYSPVQIYRNHCQYSHDYVLSLDIDYSEQIAALCNVHDKRFNRAKIHLLQYERPNLRLQLIWAMFRIPDMLDVELQPGEEILRINHEFLNNSIVNIDPDPIDRVIYVYPNINVSAHEFSQWVDFFESRVDELNNAVLADAGYDYKVAAMPL